MKAGRKNVFLIVASVVAGAAAILAITSLKGHDGTAAPQETAAIVAPAETTAQPAAAAVGSFDIEAAMADRDMGDKNAPVRLDEYASLSCPHCAHFSKTTFDLIKAKWIDTGKVYFVYHDFPLNAPALEATMAARCLPKESYFPFTKTLFATQESWAFGENFKDLVKKEAKLAGLSDEAYDACTSNAAFKDRLIADMQAQAAAHEIDSTPTFIINNSKSIKGALPLEEFEKVIGPLLGETPATPAPAAPAAAEGEKAPE